jgi:hypothetical protein
MGVDFTQQGRSVNVIKNFMATLSQRCSAATPEPGRLLGDAVSDSWVLDSRQLGTPGTELSFFFYFALQGKDDVDRKNQEMQRLRN